MNLNIVLDNDVILALLSPNSNDIKHCFNRLQKTALSTRFWMPCCLLAVIEPQTVNLQSIHSLLENGVQLLSSVASHWQEIPATHPQKIQALMSLDASLLAGKTVIWTNQEVFSTLNPDIQWGDHEFIYGVLAEYGYEENLPFSGLVEQQLRIRARLEKNIFTVLKHGQYTRGEEIYVLEQRLANYVGRKHCITVASGTDALLISLLALNIKPHDEVITSVFGFIAAAEMISLIGAKPIFVDIDPDTYTLNPALLEAAITPKTKAIIPQNIYGQCADFDEINAIAARYKMPVIEDALQSFGATYRGKRSGNLSAIACTSFFVNQSLSAYGDAGACFTNDDALAERVRQLSRHGQEKRYYHSRVGINGRMDVLQAAILLAKLEILTDEVQARFRMGATFTAGLKGCVKTPFVRPQNTSVYNPYVIQTLQRDALQKELQKQGISSTVHYYPPLHLQPVFSHLGGTKGQFPIAEAVADKVLSLPLHPYLTEEAQDRIIDEVKQATKKRTG
ncbi:putative PLP-dependent enzyme possibly involved in cell wall biogenesis [Beggiatoa alba B18LD]|uniref:Putative PLP-dependent enzyme possibly involved in cell wall biogenesis n=1 Tax=Beggiatoa alba B18LD TaxID=395493 RepID=I3CFX5_9GAMM|nr:DegT/DnrJ/EryC1/StrS family aminotransferase [Beggiatoa alba]EIJ42518.1 putative PLP-dependent enzyme possibly involved in cell wall biogenesis [Beggiatoa alba B18LD]